MTTTDHRPRDLARKQPAEVVEFQPQDDGRTIDGQWRKPRRTGVQRGMAILLFSMLLILFAGFLLSMFQQHA